MITDRVKNSFNKAHLNYNHACTLQLRTGERLIQFIKQFYHEFANILDAGCGTGLVTQKLLNSFHYQNCYAVDIAENLLAVAQKTLSSFNIHFAQENFEHLTPINLGFNLIFANLSLHWSENFHKLFPTLQTKLQPKGIIAFSIPLEGTFKEIKPYCSINHFDNLNTIKDSILNAGYKIIAIKTAEDVTEFNDLLTALRSIKLVGANYVAKKFRDRQSFMKIRKNSRTKISLTYHIGYFIIMKETSLCP